MEWPIILILVLAAPLILVPVVFVWYLNIAGIVSAYKRRETERGKALHPVKAKKAITEV